MSKANTSEQIYEQLRDEIMFLEILPGEFLSEIETAARFGVSRTPIRDVFKRLEYDGMLQIVPQKGTFVSLIDLSHLSDMMYLREKLELAVIEDIVETMSNTDLVKLKLLLYKQRNLFEQEMSLNERSKQFIIADNEFHRLIFNIMGKDSLWQMISQTTPHYHRFRALNNLQNEMILDQLFEEHIRILELLEQREKEDLKTLYKKHIYGGVENMAEIISKNENYFIL
ncbi:MAG: GntR family transcriptional regulator [Cellulosilyticaceae bacterium]